MLATGRCRGLFCKGTRYAGWLAGRGLGSQSVASHGSGSSSTWQVARSTHARSASVTFCNHSFAGMPAWGTSGCDSLALSMLPCTVRTHARARGKAGPQATMLHTPWHHTNASTAAGCIRRPIATQLPAVWFMRRSRGPSFFDLRVEKPLLGSSNCGELTPKSSSTPAHGSCIATARSPNGRWMISKRESVLSRRLDHAHHRVSQRLQTHAKNNLCIRPVATKR